MITQTLTQTEPAARLLALGHLVAFPTETVYGLGADATNDDAVAAIYAAKGRPRFNPLIIHLADIAAVQQFAILEGAALRLAQAFWPGPITLVLPVRPGGGLSPLVTAGLDTVAVRIPDLALARAVLSQSGKPIAAPSANPSGRVSPTTAQHVLDGLGGKINAVLDGGPCGVGLESTIIGFDPVPGLLRPGGLANELISAQLGQDLRVPDPDAKITAPGQLLSHYAPVGTVRLNATHTEPGETLLGFGPVVADLNLSPSADLAQAAANLFRHLRQLDAQGALRIAVSPIPETGLGLAINDRLRRAAAPRP